MVVFSVGLLRDFVCELSERKVKKAFKGFSKHCAGSTEGDFAPPPKYFSQSNYKKLLCSYKELSLN